jgi:hypothetical protein
MFSLPQKLLVLGSVLTLVLFSCGQSEEAKDSQKPTATPEESAGESEAVDKDPETADKEPPIDSQDSVSPLGRKLCKVLPDQIPEKFTIANVIQLINLMPKPVTAACVIDLLPKPLRLTLTDSVLSAQPAVDQDNPRIFINVDSLIVSIALSGFGSMVMEFSELVTDTTSVKGEIEIPVLESLESSAPFERILEEESAMETSCGVCHFGEKQAPAPYPDMAFISNALKPRLSQILPISNLTALRLGCQSSNSPRCQILESLFLGGDPVEYTFPLDMAEIF